MAKVSGKQWVVPICAALAVTTVIAFEPVRHNNFIDYDDNEYVTENPHVSGGLTRESVVWAFTSSHVANWHPLTWLSHMLDCQLFGLSPYWHHLSNLFFHVANALLLFWVLQRMTGAVRPSAFVAAVFAVHPLHVESVAWVAERKDVLSGLFWMLTLAAYIRYTERPRTARYLVVFCSLALGLMAKPMLVTMPFVLLLLDYWPLRRFDQAGQDSGSALPQHRSPATRTYGKSITGLIVEKIPLFVLAAGSSVVTYTVQQSWGAMEAAENLPLSARLSNALVSYLRYIGKVVYPSRLGALYPFPAEGWPAWQAAVSFSILLAVTAAVIYAARSRRYLAVGWLWYLATLVPVIGLVQVGAQAMADRYTYLPSVGLFIMLAWGAAEVLPKWCYARTALGVIAGLVVVILTIFTRMQVRHWESSAALYEHTITVTDNNCIMHYKLGNVLRARNQLDRAVTHYSRALQIKPDYAQVHNNLGVVLRSRGQLDKAVNHYRQALQSYPDFAEAHYNLANALSAQGKLDESIHHYLRAVQIRSEYAEAHYNLGIALKSQSRLAEAISHYRRALQLRPNDVETSYNLGNALLAHGQYEEAVRAFRHVLELQPDHAKAHNNLATTFVKQGRFEEAVRHYRRALEIEPDFSTAKSNLDIILKSQSRND